MQRLGWMMALVVAAIACSTGADMVGEMLDAGVPDAGAQPGEIILQCDIEATEDRYTKMWAKVPVSELDGPFRWLLCYGDDYPFDPTDLLPPTPPELTNIECQDMNFGGDDIRAAAANSLAVISDGYYWFDCGSSASLTGVVHKLIL